MPPRVIGITGSIGSGKSLVGRILQGHGYKVIDTDEVVHDLFANDKDLKDQVVARFGNGVIAQDGTIDRIRLGALVFENNDARIDLERIVHPAVLNACDRIIDTLPSKETVFILVPLLFEAGLEKRYFEVWTVTTEESKLRARVKERNGLNDDQITKRLSAQLPQPEKARRSNRVINNSGTPQDTEVQLEAILKQLNAEYPT